jgi:hypothetical protein
MSPIGSCRDGARTLVALWRSTKCKWGRHDDTQERAALQHGHNGIRTTTGEPVALRRRRQARVSGYSIVMRSLRAWEVLGAAGDSTHSPTGLFLPAILLPVPCEGCDTNLLSPVSLCARCVDILKLARQYLRTTSRCGQPQCGFIGCQKSEAATWQSNKDSCVRRIEASTILAKHGGRQVWLEQDHWA